MKKVYIDGMEGTTGLVIQDRLAGREDIEIIKIDHDRRKDPEARAECFAMADLSILCLPDAAAVEAISLMGENVRVIDASTAHRVHPDWVYGLPELSAEHRERIKSANRVTNPGCHATGFIVTVYPLVKAGLLPADYPVCCQSITGYSGGGKKLIADYETEPRLPGMESPRPYALSLSHKHLPEMQKVCGLSRKPLFTPILGDFYQGMIVMVPLDPRFMKGATAETVAAVFEKTYENETFVHVISDIDKYLDKGCLSATACNHTNRIELFVTGDDEQILLLARFDNLGKGACGAAIQNMNLMLGLDEGAGLQ